MNSNNDQSMDIKIPPYEEVIVEMYEKCGIQVYDTKTIQQILRFMQKYVKDILSNASEFKLISYCIL